MNKAERLQEVRDSESRALGRGWELEVGSRGYGEQA